MEAGGRSLSIPDNPEIIERRAGHDAVKRSIAEGRYEAAIEQINQTRKLYGDNVNLIADLVCCYYMTSNPVHWRNAVLELEYSLRLSNLSFESRFYSTIIYAQAVEEAGDVMRALRIYSQLSHQLRPESKWIGNSSELPSSSQEPSLSKQDLSISQKDLVSVHFQVAAHRMRLKYQFGLDLQDDFDLQNFTSEGLGKNTDAHWQHTQIWREIKSVGLNHAYERLRLFLLQNRHLNEADRAFFILEFFEASIMSGQSVPSCLMKDLSSLSPKDLPAYEELLCEIAQGLSNEQNFLSRLQATSLTLGQRLRVLTLAIRLSSNAVIQAEAYRAFIYLLKGLPEDSAQAWISYLDLTSVSFGFAIEYNPSSNEIFFGPLRIDCGRKEGVRLLFELFSKHKVYETSELSAYIWKLSLEPNVYHRLRVMISRFSQILEENLKFPPLFEVNMDTVRLDARFNLIIRS